MPNRLRNRIEVCSQLDYVAHHTMGARLPTIWSKTQIRPRIAAVQMEKGAGDASGGGRKMNMCFLQFLTFPPYNGDVDVFYGRPLTPHMFPGHRQSHYT